MSKVNKHQTSNFRQKFICFVSFKLSIKANLKEIVCCPCLLLKDFH